MSDDKEHFYYSIYGISIQSQLRLMGISESNETPSSKYTLTLANLSHLKCSSAHNPLIKRASKEGFYVEVRRVVSFITNGENIYVHRQSANRYLVESALLYNLIPLLLSKNGYLVINGGGFYSNDSSTLILGPSGIGISSLLLGAMKQGGQFVSDTFCALANSGGAQPMLIPSGMNLKVWHRTLSEFGFDKTGLKRTRPEIDKYYYPTKSAEIMKSTPVSRIVFLEITPYLANNFLTRRLSPLEALEKAGKFLSDFPQELIGKKQTEQNFLTISQLFQSSIQFEIQRRVPSSNLNELMNELNAIPTHE